MFTSHNSTAPPSYTTQDPYQERYTSNGAPNDTGGSNVRPPSGSTTSSGASTGPRHPYTGTTPEAHTTNGTGRATGRRRPTRTRQNDATGGNQSHDSAQPQSYAATDYSETTPLNQTLKADPVPKEQHRIFKFFVFTVAVLLAANVLMGHKIMSIIDPLHLELLHEKWSKEIDDHQLQRTSWENERKSWERERFDHEEELRRERQEKERVRREREREVEERHRREEQERHEEEERVRLGLYWNDFQGASECYAHGTREYSARLMNVPSSYDGIKGCWDTPITVHDVTVNHPHKCDNRGYFNGIYGYFLVKSGETSCLPHWGTFEDKGCVTAGSHTRKIESRLWNIAKGDNWNRMCMTTPANFRDLHFDGPVYCEDKGVWGIYGVWEVEDLWC